VSRIQDWRVKIQTHSPVWQVFFRLTDPFNIFGQLFSDLASENTEQLASLASDLKNVSTPLMNNLIDNCYFLSRDCIFFFLFLVATFFHIEDSATFF
jgi:hypothetical protein